MKIFEGKSPEERNKLIAAIVLGILAVCALTYTFGGMFYGGKKASTSSASASPTPTPSPAPGNQETSSLITPLPSRSIIDQLYAETPVVYNPGLFYSAPDAARNIFAFYEPPPYVPTPIPSPTRPLPKETQVPIPSPLPPPPIQLSFLNVSSIYAGSKGFKLVAGGDRFTAEMQIYLNGSQLPTSFVSAQQLSADVPAAFIAAEGQRTVIVQTPDGKLYSNQLMMNVMAPPRPQSQYIGMIARRGYNNDTAYLEEKGKTLPVSARLNDVVEGRFRLVSISNAEVIFEDKELGFRHKVPLKRAASGAQGSGGRANPNPGSPYGFPPGINPNPGYNPPPGEIPGIPSNIPRYVPPQPQPAPDKKQDSDDYDDDGDGR